MTTLAAALPVLWALAVGFVGWGRRPRCRRVDQLVPPAGRQGDGGALTARLGVLLRRPLRRPPGPVDDATVGALAVVAVVALLAAMVWAPLGFLVGAVAWGGSAHQRRSKNRRAVDAVVQELPEVVDLFVLAASAGLTVPLAVSAVAARSTGWIGRHLRTAVGRARMGEPLADALDGVIVAVGEPVRPLIGALVASERYGTMLLPELERAAVEARLLRRRRFEASARRLSVQLLFPLVLCTLPAFLVLTVIPMMAGALRTLDL